MQKIVQLAPRISLSGRKQKGVLSNLYFTGIPFEKQGFYHPQTCQNCAKMEHFTFQNRNECFIRPKAGRGIDILERSDVFWVISRLFPALRANQLQKGRKKVYTEASQHLKRLEGIL
ncbi:MAG: hypothetical protein IJ174_10100 [Clostridia bacterium]|nr:hypothetical protein [Clostridia bacterium]